MSGFLEDRATRTHQSVMTPSLLAVEHHHAKPRLISPQTQNQLIFAFDPDTKKNKSFSTTTQKTNQFRSLHWTTSTSIPRDWNKSDSTIRTNTKSISTIKRFAARIEKLSQFQPTQKLCQSIATLKTIQFRPAHSPFRPPAEKTGHRSHHQNQVKFDRPHKTEVVFDATMKSRQIDPHSKPQVDYDAPTQKNIISIQTPQQGILHPHTKKRSFDPYNEVKTSSILLIDSKSAWTTHTTTSRPMLTQHASDFRPAYKSYESQFRSIN